MDKKFIKNIRDGKKPVFIFICGMPGTRKSSTAVRLGGMLDFSTVVGMDEIRDIMLLYDKRQILQGKSHDRWKLFGSLNDKNFFKGFWEHSRALQKGVMAIIKKNTLIGENSIIEGVHLAPSLYKNISNVRKFHFLLTAKNFNHHQYLLNHKFGRRHGIQKPWDQTKIKHVEKIQEILIKEAKINNVCVIESENPEKNCKKIIEYIKNRPLTEKL